MAAYVNTCRGLGSVKHQDQQARLEHSGQHCSQSGRHCNQRNQQHCPWALWLQTAWPSHLWDSSVLVEGASDSSIFYFNVFWGKGISHFTTQTFICIRVVLCKLSQKYSYYLRTGIDGGNNYILCYHSKTIPSTELLKGKFMFQAWWYRPVTPALERQKQADYIRFQSNWGANSMQAT